MIICNLHKIFCFDIVKNIAYYIDDIDIHIKYKISNKLKKEKYENLNYIGYINIKNMINTNLLKNNFKYNIKNMYKSSEREKFNLKNDYITLTYNKNMDKIWITIYRIKPKKNNQIRQAGWSTKELSDTYFWEYFTWIC